MDMSPTLQEFLAARHATYEVLSHPHTSSSTDSAQAAHVSGRTLAKAVVVKDGSGYVLAVLPANEHVSMQVLSRKLRAEALRLASEPEIGALFRDCERGAIPPVGEAYGMRSVIEEELDGCQDLFLEAGDHRHLVHVTQPEFARLTAGVPRAHFSSSDRGLGRMSGGET